MKPRLYTLVLFFSAILLLFSSPAISDGSGGAEEEGVSPRCEAAIDRAAGSYSKCLLKARARFAKRGNEHRLARGLAKCEQRFGGRVDNAVNRLGNESCTDELLIESIAHRSASFAEAVATEASGHSATKLSWEFTQSGPTGSISFRPDPENPEGPFLGILHLESTHEVLAFTDRPAHLIAYVPNSDFQDFWRAGSGNGFETNPPNAVLHFQLDSGISYADLPLVLKSGSYLEVAGEIATMIYEIIPDGSWKLEELSELMSGHETNCQSIEVESSNSSGTETAISCTLENPELFIDGWTLIKRIGEWGDDVHHVEAAVVPAIKIIAVNEVHDIETSFSKHACTIILTAGVMTGLTATGVIESCVAGSVAAAAAGGSAIRLWCTAMSSDMATGFEAAGHLADVHIAFPKDLFTEYCGTAVRSSISACSVLVHGAASLVCTCAEGDCQVPSR